MEPLLFVHDSADHAAVGQQMMDLTAVEVILSTINLLCNAQPVIEMKIEQEIYIVREWRCETQHSAPLQVRGYARICPGSSAQYPGRQFYAEFDAPYTKYSVYLSRSGELIVGPIAQLEEAHAPVCG